MTLKDEFDKYFNVHFNNQELYARLFYSFPIGIRFEIGFGDIHKSCAEYVKAAAYRACAIFSELFAKEDMVYIAVNSFEDDPDDLADSDISIVRPLIKHYLNECRFTFTSTHYDFSCIRYILQVRVKDIQIERLVEEIIFSGIDGRTDIRGCVYLINPRNNIIFWLYDNRGLDVISNDKANLINVYKKFNHWILDYDREKINSIFTR